MHAGMIRATRAAIQRELNRLNKEMIDLQSVCPHTNVKKEPKSNTGNWCPQDDHYWYDCTCPDCGKWWTEDQ